MLWIGLQPHKGRVVVCAQPQAAKKAAFEPDELTREHPLAPRPIGRSSESDARRPSAYLGLGTSNYDGRHSEGNRFIGDDHL